jgi:hypothetical protein
MSNSAQRKPGEANPIVQLATVIAIAAVLMNVAFYFLSDAYFTDRVKRLGDPELARLSGARIDFAIFTLVIGAATIKAVISPRLLAHGIPALTGLASLAAGIAAFASDLSLVLPFTLLVVAGVFELLVRQSLRRSRVAWACLSALCIVYCVVTLFGAPKIRSLLGVGMWIAMIVPGLLAVATAALRMVREDYREPA